MRAFWNLTRREMAGFFLSLGGYIIIAAALFRIIVRHGLSGTGSFRIQAPGVNFKIVHQIIFYAHCAFFRQYHFALIRSGTVRMSDDRECCLRIFN